MSAQNEKLCCFDPGKQRGPVCFPDQETKGIFIKMSGNVKTICTDRKEFILYFACNRFLPVF